MPPSLPCAPSFVIVLLAIRLLPVTEATSTAAAPPVRRCVPLTVLPVKVMLAPDSLTPSSPLPPIRLLVIWLPVLDASAKRMPSLLLSISRLAVIRLLSAAPVMTIAPTAAGGRLVVVASARCR